MALLNALQSGLFLTAGTEPAATQSFGGAGAGGAQRLSVPSASGLRPLLLAGLCQGEKLEVQGKRRAQSCWGKLGQRGLAGCGLAQGAAPPQTGH